jgi:hypothetical protein
MLLRAYQPAPSTVAVTVPVIAEMTARTESRVPNLSGDVGIIPVRRDNVNSGAVVLFQACGVTVPPPISRPPVPVPLIELKGRFLELFTAGHSRAKNHAGLLKVDVFDGRALDVGFTVNELIELNDFLDFNL